MFHCGKLMGDNRGISKIKQVEYKNTRSKIQDQTWLSDGKNINYTW